MFNLNFFWGGHFLNAFRFVRNVTCVVDPSIPQGQASWAACQIAPLEPLPSDVQTFCHWAWKSSGWASLPALGHCAL